MRSKRSGITVWEIAESRVAQRRISKTGFCDRFRIGSASLPHRFRLFAQSILQGAQPRQFLASLRRLVDVAAASVEANCSAGAKRFFRPSACWTESGRTGRTAQSGQRQTDETQDLLPARLHLVERPDLRHAAVDLAL